MIRERSCAVKEEKPCGSLGVELNGGSLFRKSRGIEQNNEKRVWAVFCRLKN